MFLLSTMVLKNISEEIKRIEVELGELNSTTFEHSMKRIKHKTWTQAHQTVRKSDSGITSEGQTKFRFKRREKKTNVWPWISAGSRLNGIVKKKMREDIKIPILLLRSHPTIKKPATFDGSDYKSHFEVCAALNGWKDREKGFYLEVSLRGNAQGCSATLLSN